MIRNAFASMMLLVIACHLGAQEPVGSIVGWYDSLPGTPALISGWERCDGQVLVDQGSPYDGKALPDLNLAARFLRGGAISGVLQADAFQGHRHSVTHNALKLGVNSFHISNPPWWVEYIPTHVNAIHPISDGVHGEPRDTNETRPINACVTWLLKTRSALAPVGAVVAWHPDLSGTPSLPAGWVPCEGQILDDVESPYHGLALPYLNTAGRFLRGAPLSGVLQGDAFQGHHHHVAHDAMDVVNGNQWARILDADWGLPWATIECGDPISDGINGTPRIGAETRPVNMSVVWILKVKQASLPLGSIVAWHQDLPGTPPLPPTNLPCDGSLVDDGHSPFDGQVLPELNASERFLRGAGASGAYQPDTLQGHRHSIYSFAKTFLPGSTVHGQPGVGTSMVTANVNIMDPVADPFNGTPRTADETRPINMSVVWLLQHRGTWADLGHALAGLHGQPLLTASGNLASGDELVLNLTGARENTTAYLVMSPTRLDAPLKGGVLVPALDVPGFPVALPTGPLGQIPISVAWPTYIPAGFTLYFQYWIVDAAGPVGFSASNAVSGTTS